LLEIRAEPDAVVSPGYQGERKNFARLFQINRDSEALC